MDGECTSSWIQKSATRKWKSVGNAKKPAIQKWLIKR